jgi:hypothetical protein
MKKLLLLVLLLSSIQVFAQNLNDYQYVIVPTKFNDFDINNHFRLNTITKLNLEKMGFIAFYENANIPVEILSKRCDILNVEVIKGKSFLFTSVFINFIDCNGNIIFQSEIGKTKEKDFKKAYPIALEEAFQSIYQLNYKYNEKKGSTIEPVVEVILPKENVVADKPKTALPSPISAITDYSKLLFAQPTPSGFQLVDSTPKVVYKLFKTDNPSLFLAQKGNQNGVITLKEGSWFFEYQENEKVVSEKLDIKF